LGDLLILGKALKQQLGEHEHSVEQIDLENWIIALSELTDYLLNEPD